MEPAGAFDTANPSYTSEVLANGFQVIGAGWCRTGTLSVKVCLGGSA